MASYFYNGRRLQPALKNGIDVQLQTAFSDGNWPTVIRLAERRTKTSNDPYYEVVKICAETKLDGIVEKSAAAVAVDAWVRKGIVPKDIESLDLFEWACAETQGYQLNFPETLGVLRLRWAKANPRDVNGVTTCLQECLQNWDLVNAQQIAAVLDKSSNSNDRRFMYWSVLLMHLLSISPQCADGKQKIYGMLSQKQLEKSAEAAIIDGKSSDTSSSARSLNDEEEFLLYFRVLAAHATPADFLKRVLDPKTGAAKQFELGRKQIFLETLGYLESKELWDAVFDLCWQALGGADTSEAPSTLACDLRIWRIFVSSCQKRDDAEKSFDQVQRLLQRFISADPKLPPTYTKNIGLALLETVFSLPTSLLPRADTDGPSAHVEQLLVFIEANLDKASVFDDIKRYVEKLTFGEANDLLERLSSTPEIEDFKVNSKIFYKVLGLKLRYLLATCPQTWWPNPPQTEAKQASDSTLSSKLGSQTGKPQGYESCFQRIATDSLKTYQSLSQDEDFLAAVPKLDKDPRIDLALVASSSLLKLSSVHTMRRDVVGRQPWLASGIDVARFLQAIIILDTQFRRTPEDIPLQLVLVRAYILLGCTLRAKHLWDPLEVKRTILDALGPLFYDRLSSMAPNLFQGREALTEPLRSYFTNVLRDPSAVKIWDAFDSGSYSSILDMAVFNDNLNWSSTRAMAVIEERRAMRTLGGKLEDLDDVTIFSDISNNTSLVNVTDYGSIPHLDSNSNVCIAESLSVGPELSNTRMHLGLIVEQYLDLINFKAPKEYKPAKQSEAAARERAYLLESLTVVESSFADFLHLSDTPSHLTAAELSFYSILSLLASLANASLATTPPVPADPSTWGIITSSLATMFDVLGTSTAVSADSKDDPTVILRTLTDLHSLGMLREAAFAIKQTALFVTVFHERETARDRTGKSGLHKDALAEMKSLKTVSMKKLGDIKAHITLVKGKLGEPGWLDQVDQWVHKSRATGVEADELTKVVFEIIGGSVAVEDWTGQLLDNWRETIKGWMAVQYD